MKPMNYWKKAAVALMLAGFGSFGFSYQPASAMQHPVTIEDQGSFMAGGKTVTAPGTYDGTKPTDFAGETLHGDHAYVFYQKPVKAKKTSMVFLHGYGRREDDEPIPGHADGSLDGKLPEADEDPDGHLLWRQHPEGRYAGRELGLGQLARALESRQEVGGCHALLRRGCQRRLAAGHWHQGQHALHDGRLQQSRGRRCNGQVDARTQA